MPLFVHVYPGYDYKDDGLTLEEIMDYECMLCDRWWIGKKSGWEVDKSEACPSCGTTVEKLIWMSRLEVKPTKD